MNMKFYREFVNTKNNNTITEAEEVDSDNSTLVEDMKSQLKVLEQYIFNIIKEPVHFDIEETKYGPELVSKEDFADSCGVMSDVYESVKLESFSRQIKDNYYYTSLHWQFKYKEGGHNGTEFLRVWYNHPKNPYGWIVERHGSDYEKL